MNFDFSALNFETIDSNINAYPDMFLNQNGVTFTKKVPTGGGKTFIACNAVRPIFDAPPAILPLSCVCWM